MQLEETIAKELAGIIKEHTGNFIDRIISIERAIDARLLVVEMRQPEKGDRGEKGDAGLPGDAGQNGKDGVDGKDAILDNAPDDVVDEIAKAIALLAEALPLARASGHPVVVNFSPPNTGKKVKTITTRRDEAGNLVARVIED